MLKLKIFTFSFIKFVQSGLYLDFFFKKLVELFIRTYFIYTSQFFGEKFIIEYFTKKTIESWIFSKNQYFGIFELNKSFFFLQIISFFFFFYSTIIFFFI